MSAVELSDVYFIANVVIKRLVKRGFIDNNDRPNVFYCNTSARSETNRIKSTYLQ